MFDPMIVLCVKCKRIRSTDVACIRIISSSKDVVGQLLIFSSFESAFAEEESENVEKAE